MASSSTSLSMSNDKLSSALAAYDKTVSDQKDKKYHQSEIKIDCCIGKKEAIFSPFKFGSGTSGKCIFVLDKRSSYTPVDFTKIFGGVVNMTDDDAAKMWQKKIHLKFSDGSKPNAQHKYKIGDFIGTRLKEHVDCCACDVCADGHGTGEPKDDNKYKTVEPNSSASNVASSTHPNSHNHHHSSHSQQHNRPHEINGDGASTSRHVHETGGSSSAGHMRSRAHSGGTSHSTKPSKFGQLHKPATPTTSATTTTQQDFSTYSSLMNGYFKDQQRRQSEQSMPKIKKKSIDHEHKQQRPRSVNEKNRHSSADEEPEGAEKESVPAKRPLSENADRLSDTEQPEKKVKRNETGNNDDDEHIINVKTDTAHVFEGNATTSTSNATTTDLEPLVKPSDSSKTHETTSSTNVSIASTQPFSSPAAGPPADSGSEPARTIEQCAELLGFVPPVSDEDLYVPPEKLPDPDFEPDETDTELNALLCAASEVLENSYFVAPIASIDLSSMCDGRSRRVHQVPCVELKPLGLPFCLDCAETEREQKVRKQLVHDLNSSAHGDGECRFVNIRIIGRTAADKFVVSGFVDVTSTPTPINHRMYTAVARQMTTDTANYVLRYLAETYSIYYERERKLLDSYVNTFAVRASADKDAYGWRVCTYRADRAVPISQKRSVVYHRDSDFRLAQLIPDRPGQVLESWLTAFELTDLKTKMDNLLNEQKEKRVEEDGQQPQTSDSDPNVEYLCEGNVLILDHERGDAVNLPAFQAQWKQSKPIIVKNGLKRLQHELWTPKKFNDMIPDEAIKPGTIVECRTTMDQVNLHEKDTVGDKRGRVSVTEFWKGYADSHKRRKVGNDAKSSVLKLKDYPPCNSLKEQHTAHYNNYTESLPTGDYSYPEMVTSNLSLGRMNLATHLPSEFYTEPDLGPKMYIAYGLLYEPMRASTNMHLDVTDAVNLMIDVTRPKGNPIPFDKKGILDDLKENGISNEDLKRAQADPLHVGALWTIWMPEHSEKIREFVLEHLLDDNMRPLDDLPKDVYEFAEKHRHLIYETADAIHDQCLYMTSPVRQYMKQVYPDRPGIEGYTFVQMHGDAVFIPAGGAHQVRNVLSCMKVAMDFVSPEGVLQSAIVTDSFRHLDIQTHMNKTDKLQLCNIVLHACIDAVAALTPTETDTKQ